MQETKAKSQCKQSPPPDVKSKKANDADYTAIWFYIETKDSPKGKGPRRERVLGWKRGMAVYAPDSPALICAELKRLREVFSDALTAFKQADQAMLLRVGVTSKEEYAALSDVWDRTLLALESAAAALESHQATHHCSTSYASLL